MTDTNTVIAPNSLGRMKEMDFDEYERRAVTDHRVMCRTQAEFALAEAALHLQKMLARITFDRLLEDQSKNPT